MVRADRWSSLAEGAAKVGGSSSAFWDCKEGVGGRGGKGREGKERENQSQ